MSRIRAFAAVVLPAILLVACNSHSPSAPSPAVVDNSTVVNKFTGVIAGFGGTESAFQFTTNGVLIQGDSTTAFELGSFFNELGDGLTVEVSGLQRSGYVLATRIGVTSNRTVFTGGISTTNGVPPQLTLQIQAQAAVLSERTRIARNGDNQDARTLTIGQTVTVTGRVRADGTVVASAVSIIADRPGGMFLLTGTVSSTNNLGWVCPKSLFTATGYTIETDGSTSFTNTSCGALSAGDRVEVTGIVQPDFSVIAISIKKL